MGFLEFVEYLLSIGADVHVDLEHPLRVAVIHGHMKIIQCLLDHGAIMNDSILVYAALHGNLEIIQYFVERTNEVCREQNYQGVDIHFRDDVMLKIAVKNNHIRIVKYLVSKGANILAGNSFALNCAESKGYKEIEDYLKNELSKTSYKLVCK